MTKIYEALERFNLEQSGTKELQFSSELQLRDPNLKIPPALIETLVGLYRTIFTLLPGPNGRVIQFVSSQEETDCSKIVRAFAVVSANILKKSVLLLDSDPQSPSAFDFFNHESRSNWIRGLRKDNGGRSPKDLPSNNLLFVSRLSMDPGLLPVDAESTQTEEFMQKLKQAFDLAVIDSWSVSTPPKPLLFSPYVDGVVIVIDSEKTRWQIAEKHKRDLVAQGANVVGVILHNRKYPIPESVYKYIYG